MNFLYKSKMLSFLLFCFTNAKQNERIVLLKTLLCFEK